MRLLQREHMVTVRRLADELDASEASIRRDVNQLAAQGLLKRVHGGAESLGEEAPTLHGQPFSVTQTINVEQKRAIGQTAARLCRDGDSIILNGGSTTFRMAEFLTSHRLQVLTNALPIAEHLLRFSANRVLLAGGEVFREQNIVLSPFENDGLEHFYADKLFMGTQCVSALGVMETDSILARAEQRLIRQAEKVIVVADSSKFKGRGSLIVCPLARIDTVITDEGIEPRSMTMLREAGVEILIAGAQARACPADG